MTDDSEPYLAAMARRKAENDLIKGEKAAQEAAQWTDLERRQQTLDAGLAHVSLIVKNEIFGFNEQIKRFGVRLIFEEEVLPRSNPQPWLIRFEGQIEHLSAPYLAQFIFEGDGKLQVRLADQRAIIAEEVRDYAQATEFTTVNAASLIKRLLELSNR